MASDTLTPWPKGHSGNPSGRPKLTPDMQRAKDNARAASAEMVDVLLAIARDVDTDAHAKIKAANSVLDRALGKPEQAIVGADGAPLLPQFNTEGMSDEQLGAFLRLVQIARGGPAHTGSTGDAGSADPNGPSDPSSGESPP